MKDEYIVGTRLAPYWCMNDLTLYKRPDGGIGYEYHGKTKTAELCRGDKLIRLENGKIQIIRREGER